MAERILVIGLGNRMRGDDGAGLEVARRLRATDGLETVEHDGDPIELLELWAGADPVVLVDAVIGDRPPGAVHRFEPDRGPLPSRLASPASSHALGLAETIELARSLGRLPERAVVYGIEARRFALGAEMSAAVEAAVDRVVAMVPAERGALAPATEGV